MTVVGGVQVTLYLPRSRHAEAGTSDLRQSILVLGDDTTRCMERVDKWTAHEADDLDDEYLGEIEEGLI